MKVVLIEEGTDLHTGETILPEALYWNNIIRVVTGSASHSIIGFIQNIRREGGMIVGDYVGEEYDEELYTLSCFLNNVERDIFNQVTKARLVEAYLVNIKAKTVFSASFQKNNFGLPREELLLHMKKLCKMSRKRRKRAHDLVDDLLLTYINDLEVTELYAEIRGWEVIA